MDWFQPCRGLAYMVNTWRRLHQSHFSCLEASMSSSVKFVKVSGWSFQCSLYNRRRDDQSYAQNCGFCSITLKMTKYTPFLTEFEGFVWNESSMNILHVCKSVRHDWGSSGRSWNLLQLFTLTLTPAILNKDKMVEHGRHVCLMFFQHYYVIYEYSGCFQEVADSSFFLLL